VDPFPDLNGMSDQELDEALETLETDETAWSLHRRMLHGRIDLLRPVLVERLRAELASGHPATVPEGEPTDTLYRGRGLDTVVVDDLGPMPDVAALTTDELRETIIALEREEDDVSLKRRFLQGKIDILRAERARRKRGEPHVGLDDLGDILGGRR
jgi:hypothetical protein